MSCTPSSAGDDPTSEAATPGPGPLEVSFTFRPANKRGNGNRTDPTVEPGHLPRISKLMAPAIRLEGLIRRGDRGFQGVSRLFSPLHG